ncbi:MAG: NADH-quinone oxidoreductase subunit L [Gemmatimonadetes bacterium]|nr:NADH-quinone oxidoreductase subunit L [Gemmatimonadota bacterium]MBK7714218.1 NADH-quinone oxidoreductase subunit L [Gemmatimonadota bacterium]
MHFPLAFLPALAAGGAPEASGPVLPIALVLGLPLLGFLLNGALALWRPAAKTAVSLVGPGVLLGAFGVALSLYNEYSHVWHADPHATQVATLWQWIPVGDLHLAFAFQLDQLSMVMLLVITGVGSLIHLFSVGYMKADDGYARYFAYLNLFVMFMLVLVLGASFPMMFIGWEGVGLCSYLLIGFWFTEKANADAGKKAFIVNRIGDFGFLVAMFLIWQATGSLSYAEVFERAPQVMAAGAPMITAITLFLFLGCTGKSAQIPLYTWLPDAMAGPTPVSALIHAATMVTAGVYLVARANVLFALAPAAQTVVAGVGALTALFAATIGLRQYDIKKVLAYSTVSQLGYMFLGVGTGAITAGVFHLVTHAFFKALLFLGSGSVIHAMHHAYHATHSHEDAQDMRNMGGLAKYMPVTAGLMILATLAIAGIPPFAGFFSKDEILAFAFGRGAHQPIFRLFWAMGAVAALLTAFYMARLVAMTFFGANRTGEAERTHLHEAPWIMTGPLLVLGLLSVFGGWLNLPEFFPAIGASHGALHHWLEPVLSVGNSVAEGLGTAPVLPEGSTETMLVAGAVLIAVVGLGLGWTLTRKAATVPAHDAPAETGVWKVLYHKYYVDELYDAFVVRPIEVISRVLLWKKVDQGLIDGAGVNGAAGLSRALGWLGGRLQSGQVSVYVVLFLVGALYVLGMVAWR